MLGLGLGGALAQGIAIHHPERVGKLVPCCCRADMVPDFAANWHKRQTLVREGGIETIVEDTARNAGSPMPSRRAIPASSTAFAR